MLSLFCLPGHAQVTEPTRRAVAELRAKYPTFKLSPEAQQCFDGKLVDPECGPLIQDEARMFQKEQQVAEKEQQVDFVERVNSSLEQLMALSQLGMHVEHGVLYSAKADFIAKVQVDPNQGARVRAFISEVLVWRKQNPAGTPNPYRSRLIQLAKENLATADGLMPQITDSKFSDGLKDFRRNALQVYNGYLSTIR